MTNGYYIAKARIRKEQRFERAKMAHRAKRLLWRVYGGCCLAGLAFAGCVAVWEAGKILEWTWRLIMGLIGG